MRATTPSFIYHTSSFDKETFFSGKGDSSASLESSEFWRDGHTVTPSLSTCNKMCITFSIVRTPCAAASMAWEVVCDIQVLVIT